ncbi:MAG TPA: hypothetical protein VI386_13705, partial [Candidatus Sulfotelmatobacter sp.]
MVFSPKPTPEATSLRRRTGQLWGFPDLDRAFVNVRGEFTAFHISHRSGRENTAWASSAHHGRTGGTL